MKMRKKLQTRDKSWGSKTSFLNVSQKKKRRRKEGNKEMFWGKEPEAHDFLFSIVDFIQRCTINVITFA